MNLKALGPNDTKACLELDALALGGLWSKQHWQKELSDCERICVGIAKNSDLLAMACGWIVIDELQLTAIAVHPKYRRQGLGKSILKNLLNQAKLKGVIKATLEVSNTNDAAKALYKSMGFTTKGERKSYYQDGSDALLQWKDLETVVST